MKIAIYGAGGFAREVLPIVRNVADINDEIVFVSDINNEIGDIRNGISVVSYKSIVDEHAITKIVIAIADHSSRRYIYDKCVSDGLGFLDVVASTHRSYDDVFIGEGCVICDNTIITSNVRIGKQFHCNIFSYVAHDCVIGDFVTFAPRVCCNGRIFIEDDAYIGTGAMLRPGTKDKFIRIGKGAIVGMGAVVTNDIPPGVTVVGNPARKLDR